MQVTAKQSFSGVKGQMSVFLCSFVITKYMCGIIGYTGNEQCTPILLQGLRTLEYRGYDSAGISVNDNGIKTIKAKGKLEILEEKLKNTSLFGTCGIGHTRWATHGAPSDENSHPHTTENLAMVHNGIIENYAEIAEILKGNGYTFDSQTDTETAAKLVDMFYKTSRDARDAIFHSLKVIRGSYAFGVIFKDEPDVIYAVRKDSPLIVALNDDGAFIASDIPAILKYTKRYYRLDEGVVARLEKNSVCFYDLYGNACEQRLEEVDWNVEQAQKGGYPHFMLKEINEEPEVLRKTVEPRIVNGRPYFNIPKIDGDHLTQFDNIHIVACGTAMHAGLIGKAVIERLARIPVNVEIASEFRYRDPILKKNDLVIVISQSGETADTLAALRHAKKCGVYTLGIVNVIGSSVAREADSVIYTWAGPEIAVASTKAFVVQCAILYLLAFRFALAHKTMTEDEVKELTSQMLKEIPAAIQNVLDIDKSIEACTKKLITAEHLFYIGRDRDYSMCIEASLKLKEISYIHSEAYAAGELKHGTISLITDGVPVIAFCTVSKVCEKTISGIREVKSRGAYVIAVCSKSVGDKFDIPCDDIIVIPDTPNELFMQFPSATVMQLIAYHTSALKGLDVDKPRNLAKSVTVE